MTQLDDIHVFLDDRSGPDHEFLDQELENARQKFRSACDALVVELVTNTFSLPSGRQGVECELELTNPDKLQGIVEKIHVATDVTCLAYDELVRIARQKLKV